MFIFLFFQIEFWSGQTETEKLRLWMQIIGTKILLRKLGILREI